MVNNINICNMVKIEIKNRWTGSILFSYEKESNTVKETLLKAIKDGANLDGANLVRANLYGANLDGANLYGANLDGANLVRANLVRANLDGANLDGANLYGANLDGANLVRANLVRANLDGANLDGANLDGANLYGANLPMFSKWALSIKREGDQYKINIGCKTKTVEEWVTWFEGNETYETKRDTVDFSRIKGMFYAFKVYIETVGYENLFPENPEAGAAGKATAEKFKQAQ